jgi:hypothetical protein
MAVRGICDGGKKERLVVRIRRPGSQRALLADAYPKRPGSGALPQEARKLLMLGINLERAKGFEPSTPTLARSLSVYATLSHSTPCPLNI